MKKDDEADMADRVLLASDWAAMWAHIAVEAQTNPTYAIAYAILMLADKVEDMTEAQVLVGSAISTGCEFVGRKIAATLADNATEIATAIERLTDEVAIKRINEEAWSVATDGTVTKAG